MNCYFDTSIYNHILDDSNSEKIVEEIKRKQMTTIPSVVNLCEILATPHDERKKKLIALYDNIRNEYHALKPFTTLLRDATMALQAGEDEIRVNMPIMIDEKTEELCKEALKDVGKEFDDHALMARDWISKNQEVTNLPDASIFFETIEDSTMQPTWIKLFRVACQGLGIKELKLDEDTIMKIIKSPDTPWKYYLDTTLYIFYKRALCTNNYGKKKNPSGADLQQGIYLCWADIFVIRDGVFYSFMKGLKEIRNYRKEIFNYSKFKNYMGIFR